VLVLLVGLPYRDSAAISKLVVPGAHEGSFARVLELMCRVLMDIVSVEPRVVPLTSPVYVMGDLHGESAAWGCCGHTLLGLSLSHPSPNCAGRTLSLAVCGLVFGEQILLLGHWVPWFVQLPRAPVALALLGPRQL
jgi:hypothetical protein